MIGFQEPPSVSYENSKRLMEQNAKMREQIDMMADIMHKQREQVRKEVNKAIYDLAEKQGVSIYDVCFHYAPVESVPQINYEDIKDPLRTNINFEMEVKLVPIKFELEKGGGYWKDKYFRLKEKMQAIIDNKED